MDGNGRVSFSDVMAIVRHVGKRRFDSKYDLNGDGKVTGRDVMMAIRQLGRRCEL
jgi:hypothetical protein